MCAALITGGARRIGRHLARAAAAHGHAVAIHYRSSRAAAEAVAVEIARAGGRAATVQADLADPGALGALLAAAAAAVGPITCLVNNASTFEFDRAVGLDVALWDAQLAVNLRAPMLLARDFARALPDDGHGLIVNLLDQRIAAPAKGYTSYTLSKIGLAAATELLAFELAPRIRVNGIAPGLTLVSGAQSEIDFARVVDNTPLGKGSSPQAVARAFDYLLEADTVTGQILFVDGGKRLMGRVPDDPAMVGARRGPRASG